MGTNGNEWAQTGTIWTKLAQTGTNGNKWAQMGTVWIKWARFQLYDPGNLIETYLNTMCYDRIRLQVEDFPARWSNFKV